MNPIVTAVKALFAPIASIINKHQDRQIAKDSAKAKLIQAKQENHLRITMSDAEWEVMNSQMKGTTWTDEYVTVSIVSIVNLMVIGGLEAAVQGENAFVLEGVALALTAMAEAGMNVGFVLEAVVLAAVGYSIWRKS